MAIERAKFWLKRPSSSVKMKAKMLDMIAAHIVSYDVWFYVSHLALHRPSLYWIHKRHHEYSLYDGMCQSVDIIMFTTM